MTDHWMISFALPYETLMPFLLHMNGQFIFNEKDARKLLKEHRVKYPFLDFHLIKNGGDSYG